MKKKILSLALVLLLMFSILPSAYAEEYCTLGSCSAGQSLNSYISSVSSNASVVADTLPEGCVLSVESGSTGNKLYLRGMPTVAGMQSFTINVTGVEKYSIVCSLDVYPATPVLTRSADISCIVGDYAILSVGARVADGGALNYQWFYDNGQMVAGATGNTLTPDTSRVGVSKYYCEVTNTNNGRFTSVTTDLMSITVSERVVQSVAIETLPTKNAYNLGDRLSTSGLSIRVYYSNGTSEVISEGFNVFPTELSVEGTQTIQVTYNNQKCTYQVSVKNQAEVIEGIGVVTLPNKVEYIQGDSLQTAGLSIRVYTNSGHYDIASGLDCSPTVLNTAGSQSVTVAYGGKTCSFTVTVKKQEDQIISVSVATKPTKTEYFVGDTLDTTGLVLQVTTNNGTEKVSTGFSCTPKVLTTVGPQAITVTYGQFNCSFNVSVKEKASPSPSASPTASVSPSPEGSEDPASPTASAGQEKDSEKGGSVNVLVVIIFVIAVLGLGSLAAYVYIMQRKGQR